MPYGRGNGAMPPWADSISQPLGPLLHHEGRISALETTAGHHHERLAGLEEAAEEFRRHRSLSLGAVIERFLPDIKWLIVIGMLAGAKLTLPPVVRDILSGVAAGGLGFN